MATTRPAPASGSSRAAVVASPTRYAPMAHPATPRRWDQGSILRALAGWVAEVGRPPRRQDWTGERPAQAALAQRKWMREHPRWPSSSCVAAHFGSWSAALAAAGLTARRLTRDSSVAERVDAACRMAAAGMTLREIARELDVCRSTVHNYLRARQCADCRGPVTTPHAQRCATCNATEPTVERAWSRDSVSAAIRDWRAEHGSAPSHREWTPSRTRPGRWETESPRWPSAAVVCALYRDHADPWNAALLDAGAEIRFRRWSDEDARAALAAFWIGTGHQPGSSDLSAPAWAGPHPATLRRRYGSVVDAWRTLGPAPTTGESGVDGRADE
jgi:AcrR family transcriptional regulator